MKNFLGPNSAVGRGIGSITDCGWNSLLWLIFSMPVVTIGAATAAVCRVSMNKIRHEDHNTGTFFRAFRETFVPATLAWLLLAAGFAALGFGLHWALHLKAQLPRMLLSILILAFLYALIVLGIYVFPLIADCTRYSGRVSTGNCLRSALQIGESNPFRPVPVMLVMLIPLVLFLFLPPVFLLMVPFWFLLWPGLIIQWIASRNYKQITEYNKNRNL